MKRPPRGGFYNFVFFVVTGFVLAVAHHSLLSRNLPRVKICRRKFFSCPRLATHSVEWVPAPSFDS